MRKAFALLLALCIGSAVFADIGGFSSGQRTLGPIIISELSIREGVLAFRADSGGCSGAASFAVDVVREEGVTALVPHYRLTIRRVVADDCKALLWEGVLIEMSLADLGLEGMYTVSVENPVSQEPPEGQ